MSNTREKRKHPRIYFTLEDGIFTALDFPEKSNESVTTNMLSLSEGGVSFIFNKENVANIFPGEKIKIKKVIKPESLSFLTDVETEVKHIVTDNELNHIVCGCQFLDLKKELKNKIQSIVESVSDETCENISI
jgi:c-di-GMP-binding flagellar brake protein YcgR